MNLLNQLNRFSALLTISLIASVCSFSTARVRAADTDAEPGPGRNQQTFASPDEAIKALRAAAEAQDDSELLKIFGPQYKELATGDKVQDANNRQHFAAAMAQGCNPVTETNDTVTLEVGTNNWPMPIPLVKTNGMWFFDTAAGKEEIINRHIGKDELAAIGVCRAYVKAQRQYAEVNSKNGGGTQYAMKFKSSSGKRDGLYWPPADNEPASPFGPLVAEAHAEGYGNHKSSGLHAFHGYYFRILTRQGANASGGKMNYVSNDNLTGGFALVAYPERWDQSGVMTFIVNQDGKVYQKDLGEKTARMAGRMKEYNPDDSWTMVSDEGLSDIATEK